MRGEFIRWLPFFVDVHRPAIRRVARVLAALLDTLTEVAVVTQVNESTAA